MTLISHANIKTVVRFVYMVVIALTLVYATAYAADKKAVAAPAAGSAAANPPQPGIQLINPSVCPVGDIGCSDKQYDKEYCREQARDLNSKMSEVRSICTDNSAGECSKRYKECYGTSTSSKDTRDAWAKLLGTPAPAKTIAKNCNIKPRDYFTRRKESRDKIESIEKDIKGLEKEDSEIDKDYQDQIQKLQEAFAKEQKDLDDLQEEIQNKNMEEEKAALEEDQKATKNLSQLNQDKMNLRNDLSTATVNAQAEMLQVSDEIAKGDCMAQVKKFKTENAISNKSTSAGSLIGNGGAFKKQLEARFDACMQLQTIRRQEISRKLTEKVSSINMKLDDNAQQIQQLEEYNKTSAAQREKRTTMMTEKKNKAVKASAQKVQQIQAQLTQAGEMAKKKHASTQKAISLATQSKTTANAELLALGVEDTAAGNIDENKSTKMNIDTWNSYLDANLAFNEACCKDNPPASPFCTNVKSFIKDNKPISGTK